MKKFLFLHRALFVFSILFADVLHTYAQDHLAYFSVPILEANTRCTKPIQIVGRVWKDANFNRIQDPDESGFPSLTLQLWDDQNLLDTQRTDGRGQYRFTLSDFPKFNLLKVILNEVADFKGPLANVRLTEVEATSPDVNSDAVPPFNNEQGFPEMRVFLPGCPQKVIRLDAGFRPFVAQVEVKHTVQVFKPDGTETQDMQPGYTVWTKVALENQGPDAAKEVRLNIPITPEQEFEFIKAIPLKGQYNPIKSVWEIPLLEVKEVTQIIIQTRIK
ncbi:MAG: hypothetical protein JNN12_03710 [Bacteroidetes Order II. Incertae sedis bacterium]|nr:hypothetical protein [Bacteroidetes Order II. bacterium]